MLIYCLGYEKIVEDLVRYKADVNFKNIDGYRPIQLASENGHFFLHYMLQCGFDIMELIVFCFSSIRPRKSRRYSTASWS